MSVPVTEIVNASSPPRLQARAVLTRNGLLDAALKVIRSKGYSATTVDDICAAASVTKGSFFHHFANKEELAIEAARYWNELTGGLFANAPYHQVVGLYRLSSADRARRSGRRHLSAWHHGARDL
jgi:AcrR family transcriptional regulator